MTLNLLNTIFALFFLLVCAFRQVTSKNDYFDAVPKELRCSGCDLTVKVFNHMLDKVKKEELEQKVELAMQLACDEKRLSISEYKVDYMVKTCNFMIEYHGQELKDELIKYYSKPKRPSYVMLSQKICLNVMRLCPGETHGMEGMESSFEHFKHFMAASGKEAKIAKPVGTSHDEL